jgi:hypothetical protein
MANPPLAAPLNVKSDEAETINARDRAVHASRKHLLGLIREHPERVRVLLRIPGASLIKQ